MNLIVRSVYVRTMEHKRPLSPKELIDRKIKYVHSWTVAMASTVSHSLASGRCAEVKLGLVRTTIDLERVRQMFDAMVVQYMRQSEYTGPMNDDETNKGERRWQK